MGAGTQLGCFDVAEQSQEARRQSQCAEDGEHEQGLQKARDARLFGHYFLVQKDGSASAAVERDGDRAGS